MTFYNQDTLAFHEPIRVKALIIIKACRLETVVCSNDPRCLWVTALN